MCDDWIVFRIWALTVANSAAWVDREAGGIEVATGSRSECWVASQARGVDVRCGTEADAWWPLAAGHVVDRSPLVPAGLHRVRTGVASCRGPAAPVGRSGAPDGPGALRRGMPGALLG